MRKLFLLGFILSLTLTGPAFANCQLDAKDFDSLALSKSKIHSQAQIDALDAAHQNLICTTRASWRQFHANGNRFLGTPTHYSGYYMTPYEEETYSKAVDDWLEVHMLH